MYKIYQVLLPVPLVNATGCNIKLIIVSQLSRCLKFMTFREGCFVIRNSMQVLKWSFLDFLLPLILQKTKEDNISQLDDCDVPFCVQQYRHLFWRTILCTTIQAWVLLYLFVQIQIIWSINTPQTASNFRYLLSCGTIAVSGIRIEFVSLEEKLYLTLSHSALLIASQNQGAQLHRMKRPFLSENKPWCILIW